MHLRHPDRVARARVDIARYLRIKVTKAGLLERPTRTAGRRLQVRRGPSSDDDIRAAGLAAASPAHATNAQLLALQRHAGNNATRLAVQRRGGRGKKSQNPLELGANVAEQTGAVNTGVGSGLDAKTWTGPVAPEIDAKTDLPKAEAPPDVADPSVRLGFAGSSFGALQGTVGTVFAGMSYAEAKTAYNQAKQRGDMAGMRLAQRQMNMAGGDIGKNVTTTVGSTTDLVAKGVSAGGDLAGGAGVAVGAGGIAAPLAVFNMLRDARKTAKAWKRCAELEATFQSWDQPRATIEKMQEQFDEAETGRVEAEAEHAKKVAEKTDVETKVQADKDAIKALNDEVTALQNVPGQKKGVLGALKGAGSAISRNAQIAALKVKIALRQREQAAHEALVQKIVTDLASLVTEVTNAKTVKEQCLQRIEQVKPMYEKVKQVVGDTGAKAQAEALKKAKGGGAVSEPSLLEIQAYAFEKNHAGRIKKLISTIGGALSAGGATAGLALAIAGVVGTATTIAMASPIGWALAAAGAAVALGLGLYKGFKWMRKRWALAQKDPLTGAPRTTGARLKKTLAFWVPAGVSRREKYGKRLLDLSLGDKCYKEQMDQARWMIGNLIGAPWDKLGLAGLALTPPPVPVTTPSSFTPTSGGTGASTGVDAGPSAHEAIDTDSTQEQAKGATQTLGSMATNKNYKAAKELITAKLGS